MYQRDFSRARPLIGLNELKTRDQRRRAAMLARSPSRYWALARMKRERARKHAEKRLKAAFSVQSNTYTQIPGPLRDNYGYPQ